MSAHEVKGWCPGALRPMRSGDGLVVRVRPFGGRLRRAQADGIATLAAAHGNGLLDLSSRGNLQIRGVTDTSLPHLIEGLRAMGLIDPSEEVESRRNILVTPFWAPGDGTEGLVSALTDALSTPDAPALPGKFGFAIDTQRSPALQNASADIRLERDAQGGLILVAEGMLTGKPVTQQTAVAEAMALADWFTRAGGGARRMSALIATGTVPKGHDTPRQAGNAAPVPGPVPAGVLVGFAFGQMRVETLAGLAKHGSLRLTPWRLLLVENARDLPDIDGVLIDPADPLLRITACTGAPRCEQALQETRALGRALAPHLGAGATLHISGCTKGCAHPRPAPLTLTGQARGFALIHNGTAADTPIRTGLAPDELKDHI
ncbi:precorrin-3B synthase [Sulfitobacter albidus]|uniref:precorrin-3B synthase n=1 Tax=Sulfitobacter albidus TaxID=2829501 RepID=UPI0020C89E96|nr:precorrin-3B synthase [Sulfitobacter albidus]